MRHLCGMHALVMCGSVACWLKDPDVCTDCKGCAPTVGHTFVLYAQAVSLLTSCSLGQAIWDIAIEYFTANKRCSCMQDPQALALACLETVVLMTNNGVGDIADRCENEQIGVPHHELVFCSQSMHAAAGTICISVKALIDDKDRGRLKELATKTAVRAKSGKLAIPSSSGSSQSSSKDPVIIVSHQGTLQ